MALQVWLPLNGDLRNLGLSNVTVTNNGATVDNNGKIGKCYSFDGNDDYVSLLSSNLYSIFSGGSKAFSVSMWIYRADATRAILFGDYSLSGSISFNIELTTGHGVRFYWAASPDIGFSGPLTASAWNHIAITYNGSKLDYYLNGIKKDTYNGTLSTKSKTSGDFYLGRDARTGSTALNGKLNDVRIYDNCLTPEEVKHIAQGLVVHYTLGNADVYEATTNVGSNDWYTYEPYWNNKSGSYGSWQLTKNSGSQTLAFSNSTITNAMAAGQTWTLSGFLYKNGVPYKTSISNPSTYSGYSILSWESRNDGYFRYTMYINSVPGWLIHSEMFGSDNAQGSVVLIKQLQFELKNHATHFTSTSRSTGLVYDSSGYCKNASISGTLTPGSSPRYNQGLDGFAAGNRIVMDNALLALDKCTYSFWCKGSGFPFWGNNNSLIMLFPTGSIGIYATNTAGTSYGWSSKSFTHNTTDWYHIAVVYDGSNVKVYVNGTDSGHSLAVSGSLLSVTQAFGGWSSSYYWTGSMSDIRVYATALSADDVKELYNLGASIS